MNNMISAVFTVQAMEGYRTKTGLPMPQPPQLHDRYIPNDAWSGAGSVVISGRSGERGIS